LTSSPQPAEYQARVGKFFELIVGLPLLVSTFVMTDQN
jgi:hypothetical protein